MKAAAIVAVATSHAIPFFHEPAFTRNDGIALTLTCFHVPAFLLVSGILYATRGPVGWRVVSERLRRILPPYLVASAAACVVGIWRPVSVRRTVFGLVTGSAIGTYYFVPVLAGCIALLPLLSRLGRRWLIAMVAVLGVYTEVARMNPVWRLSNGFFWEIRDPLLQFHLGYFVLGLIAGRSLIDLARARARYGPLVGVVCGLGVAGFVWLVTSESPWTIHPLTHTAYMLSIVGVIAAFGSARPVPAPVRFLSDATLPIYLYHSMLHPLVMPSALALSPLVRIVVMTFFGLAVGALVVVAGRRWLGSRSRLLLGA